MVVIGAHAGKKARGANAPSPLPLAVSCAFTVHAGVKNKAMHLGFDVFCARERNGKVEIRYSKK